MRDTSTKFIPSVLVALFIFALLPARGEPLPKDAQDLKRKYEELLAKESEALRSKYLVALNKILDSQTKAGRIDSAIAVRNEIRKLKPEVPEHSLKAVISGTGWQWSGMQNEKLVFGKDGVVVHAGWQKLGLKTAWEVIDRRTVLLRIASGRSNNFYAVLTFNDAMTEYSGFDFIGVALKISRRLDE